MKNLGIQLLSGVDNIKSIYKRLLHSNNVNFICLSSNYESVLGAWYDDTFAPELFASPVKTREIVLDMTDNRVYGSQKDGVKNQVRYLQGHTETDLIISDNFVAIVSFNPLNPYVLVLDDLEIVSSAQTWFKAIWDGAAR